MGFLPNPLWEESRFGRNPVLVGIPFRYESRFLEESHFGRDLGWGWSLFTAPATPVLQFFQGCSHIHAKGTSLPVHQGAAPCQKDGSMCVSGVQHHAKRTGLRVHQVCSTMLKGRVYCAPDVQHYAKETGLRVHQKCSTMLKGRVYCAPDVQHYAKRTGLHVY